MHNGRLEIPRDPNVMYEVVAEGIAMLRDKIMSKLSRVTTDFERVGIEDRLFSDIVTLENSFFFVSYSSTIHFQRKTDFREVGFNPNAPVQVKLTLLDIDDPKWAEKLIGRLRLSWKQKWEGGEAIVDEWMNRLELY